MIPIRRSLALLVVVAAAVAGCASPAAARQAPSRTYDVQISGSHVVDWWFQSRLDRPFCSAWSVGSGRVTAAFALKRRARYQLVVEQHPGGKEVLRWAVSRVRLPRFEIEHEGRWQYNDPMKEACTPCGQLSEYGPCVPDPPAPTPPACPKRVRPGVVDLTYVVDDDEIPKGLKIGWRPKGPSMLTELRYQDDVQLAGRCLPFERGEGLPLTQPAALLVPVSKLARLERGRSETFSTGRREYATRTDIDDDCRKATEPVVGMRACARTRIALDVKRVR